jgi:hypothetical protein
MSAYASACHRHQKVVSMTGAKAAHRIDRRASSDDRSTATTVNSSDDQQQRHLFTERPIDQLSLAINLANSITTTARQSRRPLLPARATCPTLPSPAYGNNSATAISMRQYSTCLNNQSALQMIWLSICSCTLRPTCCINNS